MHEFRSVEEEDDLFFVVITATCIPWLAIFFGHSGQQIGILIACRVPVGFEAAVFAAVSRRTVFVRLAGVVKGVADPVLFFCAPLTSSSEVSSAENS